MKGRERKERRRARREGGREGGVEGGKTYLMREEAVQQAPAHDCSPVGVTEGKCYFLPGEVVALESESKSVADT